MKKAVYADATYAETSQGPASAHLTVTKVVRESIPLHVRTGYGETVGQMIDAHIAQALAQGDEVQEVTLGFDTEQWNAMRGNL